MMRYAFDLTHEQIYTKHIRYFTVLLIVSFSTGMAIYHASFWHLMPALFLMLLPPALGHLRFSLSTQAWLKPMLIVLAYAITMLATNGGPFYFIIILSAAVVCFVYLEGRSFLLFTALSNVILLFPLLYAFSSKMMEMGDMVTLLLAYDLFCLVLYGALRIIVQRLAALEKNSQTFETIMTTTPSYMLISDNTAVARYISASLADWLGISKRLYKQSRPLLDLFSNGELKAIFQEIMEQRGFVEKEFTLTLAGQQHYFMLRSSPMEKEGIARYFEWMDITPIMEAKNAAEQATLAKSQFLASISHEIRTPMNAIIGMTELMLASPLASDQSARALTVKSSAMSLLGIINDVLDFSKIEARRMEIERRAFDFASFIYDTVNMVGLHSTGKAGLALTVYISPEIPTTLIGDELRIRQTLINILNNAVKYTPAGFIALRVWREALEHSAMKLCFSVRDTGIGIRKEDMGKLFGDFQRLDARKNRSIMGTGLGLAITRRLVELMNGEISVESEYGAGSTFSWFICCEKQANSKEVARVENPDAIRGVLCYEPKECNAQVMDEMFSALLVRHETHNNASAFLTRLETRDYSHLFVEQSLAEAVKPFKAPGVTLILLARGGEKPVEVGQDETLERPILITTLSDILNGRAKNERYMSAKRENATQIGSFSTHGARVLVVDDNAVNISVAAGLLQKYGIEVDTANGGQEGIDKAADNEYDIIFMDHMMPEVDGLDATRAIRGLGGRHEHDIIVALTANAVSEARESFIQAGMNDFLSKPIIISHLQEILLRYLPAEKVVRE
ncbi:MAG: response regulator [Zoogloeaceae bacterium]|jgi:signal transduction histidine kinase/CheY-like chemotaxis protein|nr:response regulator [Zoogloeaceae bacterium]